MNRRGRVRRAVRPELERVEPRELLSGLMLALASGRPTITAAQALSRRLSGLTASAAGGGGNLVAGIGNQFTPDNTATPLLGQGTPTPHEAARETFRAGFEGRYYTSPGRFSDQGTTYFYRGVGGSTNYLHGDFSMAIVTPKDATSPFIGVAVLEDKNTNSSGIQGFDLRGDRTKVDSLGRPTELQFAADPNIYSGAYFVEAATGTVSIKYGAGPDHPITAVFNSRLYTSGLTNPLVNQDLYARHNRPVRYRSHAALPWA